LLVGDPLCVVVVTLFLHWFPTIFSRVTLRFCFKLSPFSFFLIDHMFRQCGCLSLAWFLFALFKFRTPWTPKPPPLLHPGGLCVLFCGTSFFLFGFSFWGVSIGAIFSFCICRPLCRCFFHPGTFRRLFGISTRVPLCSSFFPRLLPTRALCVPAGFFCRFSLDPSRPGPTLAFCLVVVADPIFFSIQCRTIPVLPHF